MAKSLGERVFLLVSIDGTYMLHAVADIIAMMEKGDSYIGLF